ncbi:hypothetical protein [Glaciecola sp. MF2-115]|uniref:hypothetical protein n=1 Tax=Glaciecola sp. MF2-115 TaxID=3384827 RepID=UPI0039A2CFC9
MNEILLVLIIAYVFIAALLVLSMIYSEFDWKVKVVLALVVMAFYYASYYAWSEAQGWPTNKQPPNRFILHHALIVEPDQEGERDGQILLWVSDIKGQEMADTPRVYKLEYTKTMHAKVQKALSKLKGGKAQVGALGNNKRKFQSELSGSTANEEKTMIVFSDLPDLALPEK